ncbi:hypothetical protein KS4_06250 [Poriferisphaera corsica]|uniref:Uncharacterized protein n=1 Tax=Poriferisphaera corsica TaxID=2528020 RepID=A0A517YQX3_9BACT|nr:hypothetical protein KS4_06250 [Poriferisphaera corsica]
MGSFNKNDGVVIGLVESCSNMALKDLNGDFVDVFGLNQTIFLCYLEVRIGSL